MSKKSSFKSDKELDDLLRSISDSADIPHSKEDWGAMKNRLDQTFGPEPTSDKKRLVGAGVLTLIMLISLSLWLLIPSTQENGFNQVSEENPELPTIDETGEPILSSDLASKDIAGSHKVKPETDSGELTSTAMASPSRRPYLRDLSADAVSRDEALFNISSENPESSLKRLKSEPLHSWQSNTLPDPHYFTSLSRGLGLPEKSRYGQAVVEPEKRAFNYAGRLSISIQAAPDLSGVKMNQVGKAGQAVGIGLSYFLHPRLSVASGVFYSFKPYRSTGELLYGYGKPPTSLLGECDILDIPINLRFYPLEGKIQRAFISAGLSSYLMLKEHYELEYQDPVTGYPYVSEIDVRGANNHLLGVINISAGYERKLGQQLSVQVEPYFKVPLSGVGEGDISLKSTGLFVGLNFYPGRNSPR
jgi:hypothetical protein